MKTREMERALGAANPVGRDLLDGLDLEAMEADLLADLEAGFSMSSELGAGRPGVRRRRRFVLAAGPAALAAVIAAVLFLAGSSSDHPSRAYGAELVRFAESTPLLLLEGPGWRVASVSQTGQSVYTPRSSRGTGSMEFVTGPAIPSESTRISADGKVTGMAPKAVRQRKVELSWSPGRLGFGGPIVRHPIEAPVLGTTALVNTRAETAYFQTKTEKKRIEWGGPGDRQMVAIWHEDGYTLQLRGWVSGLAAFEERLAWLSRVDSQTWLDAMPAKVVKAADHDAAVREMLKGIPVPEGFKPSRIPDEGLTTNRYQVGALVTGIVSCLWFRQWGEARRNGDSRGAAEAEKAMATAKGWPILREMAKEGGYSPTVWQLAAAMPSGVGRRGWRLLPQAEGLGCARWGMPVLPWKQRLQRERREGLVAPGPDGRGA